MQIGTDMTSILVLFAGVRLSHFACETVYEKGRGGGKKGKHWQSEGYGFNLKKAGILFQTALFQFQMNIVPKAFDYTPKHTVDL